MSEISGMKQLDRNFNKLQNAMPKAQATAIRTVARRAMRKATKEVAKDIGVNVKTIRSRSKLVKVPKATSPEAVIRVNRSKMPLIRVLEKKSNKLWVGKGGIFVGKWGVERGFKQKLKNGRTHILARSSKARYPIQVVKIPLGPRLTKAFHKALDKYPTQIQTEIKKTLITIYKDD